MDSIIGTYLFNLKKNCFFIEENDWKQNIIRYLCALRSRLKLISCELEFNEKGDACFLFSRNLIKPDKVVFKQYCLGQ